MNKLIYVGGVVIVLIIIGLVLFGTGGSNANTNSSSAATTVSSGATTTNNTAGNSTSIYTAMTTINAYNTTTTIVSSNTVMTNSSIPSGCTANKYYTCSNLVFSSSNISATIGQGTGLNWSSYGIAFAPQGTPISNGVPTGIAFYTANATSTSNVGTSLPTGDTATIKLPGSSNTIGTLWACYVNSGLVYVGNGCISNGGGAGVPNYVEIATVNG